MSRFLSSDQSHAGDIAPPYSGGRGFQLQNGASLLSRGFAADGVVHIVDAAGSEIIRRLPGNILPFASSDQFHSFLCGRLTAKALICTER